MAQRDWGVEPTPEQRAWVAANPGVLEDDSVFGGPGNRHAAPARLIAAHRGARARAEARDRRVRDEDLALAGRPRLHAGNVSPAPPGEWGWW